MSLFMIIFGLVIVAFGLIMAGAGRHHGGQEGNDAVGIGGLIIVVGAMVAAAPFI